MKTLQNLLQILLFSLIMISFSFVYTQPLQIESILVDACNNGVVADEGKNEIIRIRIGSSNINLNDIRIDGDNGLTGIQSAKFPNTSINFLGWAPIGTIAAKLTTLNATITGCGKLLEPSGGILLSGKKVLIFTSTDFSTTNYNFSTLNDTLYVICQNAGNTNEHFPNYSILLPTTKTLRITDLSTSSYDEVSYNTNNLVDPSGSNVLSDGSGVHFTDAGVATYYNYGCFPTIAPIYATWVPPSSSICSSSLPIDLNTLITGTIGGTWSGVGVGGNMFNPFGLSGSINITYSIGIIPSCAITETHSIFVVPSSSATWTLPNPFCQNSPPIDLNTLITGTVGGTWSGSGVNGHTFYPSSSVGQNNITYTVGTAPCEANQTQIIIVSPQPIAQFYFEPLEGIAPLSVNFTNSSLNSNSYLWNFGTGEVSNDNSPSYIYENDGTYDITLFARSGNECIDSITKTIIVSESQVFIPNSFTPNNDGLNEYFFPRIIGNLQNYKFTIINRNGEEIYSTTNQYDKWDGKFKGVFVPPGVYYYVITYSKKGREIRTHGSITIVL